MNWLTEHRFALVDMLAHTRRQPLSVLLNVMVVGLTLVLPLIAVTMLDNSQPVFERLASRPEITIFMAVDATREESLALGSRLKSLQGVAAASFVPRDEALARLEGQGGIHPGRSSLADTLQHNPLPDAWVLRVRPNTPAETQETLANRLRTLPRVEYVQIDAAWIHRIEALMQFVRIGLIVVTGALAGAVVSVIFNTLRLQALMQRDEIELSRLVGATDRFIGRPFYYLGALQGATGALVAMLLAVAALVTLNQVLGNFARLYGTDFQFRSLTWTHSAIFIAAAGTLGWLGAILAIRKHLAVEKAV